MHYWLMKSEPDAFGIEDLKARPGQTEHWDGVRNYQARNLLREMQRGDQAFFYHSSCAEPGIAGIVQIARDAYPDHTAFDPESKYYDPKSKPEKPLWYMVDVKFVRELAHPITLRELKAHPSLAGMRLLQRGNRLSVMPVSADEWRFILKLEQR
jgi:predicted RNA-binding protein with PUA-like domain